MHSLLYIALLIISVLSLVIPSLGAPINISTSKFVARGSNSAHHGWTTYYDVQDGRGACGWNSKNNEHVVAIGKALWDQTSQGGTSTKCGKTATVSWHGKHVQVRVVDLCPACGYENIDLSPSAFQQLGDKDAGRLEGISWKFD